MHCNVTITFDGNKNSGGAILPRSSNIFVYLGSAEEGMKLEKLVSDEARRRGMLKKNGEPNVSAFVVHCVRFTIEHEKIKK